MGGRLQPSPFLPSMALCGGVAILGGASSLVTAGSGTPLGIQSPGPTTISHSLHSTFQSLAASLQCTRPLVHPIHPIRPICPSRLPSVASVSAPPSRQPRCLPHATDLQLRAVATPPEPSPPVPNLDATATEKGQTRQEQQWMQPPTAGAATGYSHPATTSTDRYATCTACRNIKSACWPRPT